MLEFRGLMIFPIITSRSVYYAPPEIVAILVHRVDRLIGSVHCCESSRKDPASTAERIFITDYSGCRSPLEELINHRQDLPYPEALLFFIEY